MRNKSNLSPPAPKMGRRPFDVPKVRASGYIQPETEKLIRAEQKRLKCTWGEAVDSLISGK
jgi:hypothetical protein